MYLGLSVVLMKKRILRMIAAVLLAIVVFSLTGLSACVAFLDEAQVFARVVMDREDRLVAVTGTRTIRNSDYDTYSELDKLKSEEWLQENVRLTADEVVRFSPLNRVGSEFAMNPPVLNFIREIHCNGFLELTEEQANYYGYEVIGRLPETENEIAISECFLEKALVAQNPPWAEPCVSAEDALGRELVWRVWGDLNIEIDSETGTVTFTPEFKESGIVVGVVDTHCAYPHLTREYFNIWDAIFVNRCFFGEEPAEGELTFRSEYNKNSIYIGERYHYDRAIRAQGEYFTGSGAVEGDMFLLPDSCIADAFGMISCNLTYEGETYLDYGAYFSARTEGMSRKEAYLEGKKIFDEYGLATFFYRMDYDFVGEETNQRLRLSGFFYGEDGYLMVGDAFYDTIEPYSHGLYDFCLVELPSDYNSLVEYYSLLEENSLRVQYTWVAEDFDFVLSELRFLRQWLLALAAVLSAFSVLLLSVFSVSQYNANRISFGVLRSLGMTNKSVWKILLIQSLMISGSVFLGGTLGAAGLLRLLQIQELMIGETFIYRYLTVNFAVIALLFALSVLFGFILSLILSQQLKRKPPLDIIRRGV